MRCACRIAKTIQAQSITLSDIIAFSSNITKLIVLVQRMLTFNVFQNAVHLQLRSLWLTSLFGHTHLDWGWRRWWWNCAKRRQLGWTSTDGCSSSFDRAFWWWHGTLCIQSVSKGLCICTSRQAYQKVRSVSVPTQAATCTLWYLTGRISHVKKYQS